MDNGEEVVIDTLYQGCHFGQYALLCEGQYNLFGRARSNLVVYLLKHDTLSEYRRVLVDLDNELAHF